MKKLLAIVTFAIMAVATVYAQTYSKELEEKAMKGDSEVAMMELGYCYQSGSGVQQDYTKAMEWYQNAANGFTFYHTDAPYWAIGYLYDQGLGVNQDSFEAMKWWRKAVRLHLTTIDGSARYSHLEDYIIAKPLMKTLSQSEKNAFKSIEAQAEKGNTISMVDLGLCYNKEIGGISQNNKKAIKWWLNAANKNDTAAIVLVGSLYENDPKIENGKLKKDRRYEMAENWYRKAADLGCTQALWQLSSLYRKVDMGYVNTDKSFEYLKKYAIAANSAGAMHNIATMYYSGYEDSTAVQKEFDCEKVWEWYKKWHKENRRYTLENLPINTGVARNYEKAFEWYQKAAELNNDQSMYMLGYMLLTGLGTDKDEVKGFEWTQKAANVGNVKAWNNLGAIYYNKHDTVQARYWWQKAKDKGNLEATTGIGQLCCDAKDFAGAYECFKISQGENHPNTLFCSGMMYYNGTQVLQDFFKAFELIKQAAELSDGEAMYRLSECYRFGYGTSKDLEKAEYWLKKSQETGNDNARGIMLLLEGDSSISSETY